jgi:hypothetical protein
MQKMLQFKQQLLDQIQQRKLIREEQDREAKKKVINAFPFSKNKGVCI